MKSLKLNETMSVAYKVVCSDMDQYYRLKNSAAITYAQDSMAAYMSNKNLAAFDIADSGLIWVVSDFSINFISDIVPIWLDELRVEVGVTEVTAMRLYFDFKIFDANNSIYASGSTCWSIIDVKTVRPVALSTVFEVLPSDKNVEEVKHKKCLVPGIKESYIEHDYRVVPSDIDFNMHTGNRVYMAVAMQFMSDDFVSSHTLRNVNIRFVRQSFLGDDLKVRNSYTEIDGTAAVISEIVDVNGMAICSMVTRWSNGVVEQPSVKEVIRRSVGSIIP